MVNGYFISTLPLTIAYFHSDGEFHFNDARGMNENTDDECELIPISPDDSEKSLIDEDAIVGSIPVPRPKMPGIPSASGSDSRTYASGIHNVKSAAVEKPGKPLFEMTDEIRIRLDAAAAASDEHVPSTAPVYHDFTKPIRRTP